MKSDSSSNPESYPSAGSRDKNLVHPKGSYLPFINFLAASSKNLPVYWSKTLLSPSQVVIMSIQKNKCLEKFLIFILDFDFLFIVLPLSLYNYPNLLNLE